MEMNVSYILTGMGRVQESNSILFCYYIQTRSEALVVVVWQEWQSMVFCHRQTRLCFYQGYIHVSCWCETAFV